MNKKILIILGILVIMGAGYFVYSNFISSEGQGSVGGEDAVIGSDRDDGGVFLTDFRTPTSDEKEGFPQGNKVLISGIDGSIEVKNFFQNAEGYWPERNEVLIKRNDKYKFIFDREFGKFNLVLRYGAKETDIPDIQASVMDLLGIGKNEMCKLKFSYSLEFDVPERIDLGTLPLCSSVLK